MQNQKQMMGSCMRQTEARIDVHARGSLALECDLVFAEVVKADVQTSLHCE